MSDLTHQVLAELDASHVDAIASRLGVDPAQADAAIRQAVPVLVGGLANTASTDDGADVVHAAAADHAGFDIGSLLGGLLRGGAGGSILGRTLGDAQGPATQGLGRSSGLGTQNAGQLLAILAPIVLSVLGKLSRNQNLDPGALGGVLGQESQRLAQGGGLLGELLKFGTGLLNPRGTA
ncbi:MAG TPA: DUF937 domain-containing protein [Dokdonella sp.]